MTIIEQIKAEIDRLYGEYKDKFHQCGDQYHLGLIDGLDMAERVLDSLESEKPSEGLEEEISRYLREECSGDDEPSISEIARHFYDLGCRRTSEKYDEIEYNRQRAEEHLATSGKTISVKPGDEATINGHKIVYDNDKDAITMEEIPEDLEEAAEKYFIKVPCSEEVKKTLIEIYKPGIDAFKAGAEWQAEHSPLPEDTVLFNKGVAEGKRLMMINAVDAIVEDWNPDPEPEITIPLNPEEFTRGDKVRVLVLKKEN